MNKDLVNSGSHEIRTPLARIKFSLELAGEDILRKPGTTDYLAEIGQDMERLKPWWNEMLAYAMFEREPETSGRLSNHELFSWPAGLVLQEQKGVNQRSIHLIFQPFFRLDGSRSRDSGGYGLGLAIAKRITRWHKGTITVGQSPLQGSSIYHDAAREPRTKFADTRREEQEE